MAARDPFQHPSTWGNPRAEQVLRRLNHVHVPEVSARTMRRRLQGIPAALPPAAITGEIPIIAPVPPRAVPTRGSGRGPIGGPGRARLAPASFSAPRDWRWFVGGLGKVLISLGILIFAFVAYQLWGTGIQYARAQDDLKDQFAEQLSQISGVAPTTVGPAVTLAQTTGSDPEAPDESVTPVATAPPPSVPATVEPAAVAQLPPLLLGDVLGLIEIPKIKVNDAIVAGVRSTDLENGVGHYPYTPFPGRTGNAAIAGHRTTHGQPFFDLDELVPGDEIVVTTLEGRFVYSVTGSKVVDPSDFTVLLGDPNESRLTLTTCHPRYSQKKRLVITAVLNPEESLKGNAQIAYSDAAVAAVDQAPEDTIVGEATGVPEADRPESVGTSAAAADATADAFSDGWFSDPDAWPQIALWGTGLILVALGATYVGRQRSNWLGALVGIFPFVVLLYFFFENVNRMMPPGL